MHNINLRLWYVTIESILSFTHFYRVVKALFPNESFYDIPKVITVLDVFECFRKATLRNLCFLITYMKNLNNFNYNCFNDLPFKHVVSAGNILVYLKRKRKRSDSVL